jgi:hypothetical protein
MTELDPLISVLSAHPKLLALVLGISCVSHALMFLADSKVTFHKIATILRWAADVLDAAPKVAGDLKAGDLPKAVSDLPQVPTP